MPFSGERCLLEARCRGLASDQVSKRSRLHGVGAYLRLLRGWGMSMAYSVLFPQLHYGTQCLTMHPLYRVYGGSSKQRPDRAAFSNLPARAANPPYACAVFLPHRALDEGPGSARAMQSHSWPASCRAEWATKVSMAWQQRRECHTEWSSQARHHRQPRRTVVPHHLEFGWSKYLQPESGLWCLQPRPVRQPPATWV